MNLLTMDEHKKAEYLITNVMRNNVEILQEYVETFAERERFEQEGIYIIDAGKCKVVPNNQDKQEQNYPFLQRGDYFGVSDFLRVKNYNFYGDIVTDSKTTCLYISREDLDSRIPSYDIEMIRRNCSKRMAYERLNITYSKKFGEMVKFLTKHVERSSLSSPSNI